MGLKIILVFTVDHHRPVALRVIPAVLKIPIAFPYLLDVLLPGLDLLIAPDAAVVVTRNRLGLT